ncbi:hypothetical protein SNEBB_005599 [Seison nebaliae]|nr:hypothetical protein SNEBB_005599 [Seison nebaliae]
MKKEENIKWNFLLFHLIFLVVDGKKLILGKPPMGWMSWQTFKCKTDCGNLPNECLNEYNIFEMAKELVRGGFLDSGYKYLVIDDCWAERRRDMDGKLVPDRKRFPNGMRHVSDKIHSLGLKFGMYTGYGEMTCAGYPGLLKHVKSDMDQFINDWNIDYLKVDGCHSSGEILEYGYPQLGEMFERSNRSIIYSCSWPFWHATYTLKWPDYEKISKTCHLYRNYNDVSNSLDSIESIINWYTNNQDNLINYHGPHHWNDLDMIIAGNIAVSYELAKLQFSFWSIYSAPLLLSADLRHISRLERKMLLNKRYLDINQDPLGKAPRMIGDLNHCLVYVKQLENGRHAILLVNLRNEKKVFHAYFEDFNIDYETNNLAIYDVHNGTFLYEVQKGKPKKMDFSIEKKGTVYLLIEILN